MKGLAAIKIAVAPLSGRIMLYRHGKNPTLALEKRDVTDDVLAVVAEYKRRNRESKNHR